MAQRVVTTETTAVAPRRTGFWSAANIIYLLFGLLEALLAFRFVFRLLGANPAAGFVRFIYNITDPFISPFVGIFGTASNPGVSTVSVFEPATLIAMAVYALVAWLIVRLIAAAVGRPAEVVDREV